MNLDRLARTEEELLEQWVGISVICQSIRIRSIILDSVQIWSSVHLLIRKIRTLCFKYLSSLCTKLNSLWWRSQSWKCIQLFCFFSCYFVSQLQNKSIVSWQNQWIKDFGEEKETVIIIEQVVGSRSGVAHFPFLIKNMTPAGILLNFELRGGWVQSC